jgi:hypothetical protein
MSILTLGGQQLTLDGIPLTLGISDDIEGSVDYPLDIIYLLEGIKYEPAIASVQYQLIFNFKITDRRKNRKSVFRLDQTLFRGSVFNGY